MGRRTPVIFARFVSSGRSNTLYALVFIVLFSGLGTYLAQRINNMMAVAWGFHDRARAAVLAAAAPEIERFYLQTGCLPTSFNDLTVPSQGLGACPGQVTLTSASLSGFEHIRANLDPAMNNLNAWQDMKTTSAPVSDGTWQFNRLALFALDPRKAASDSNYVVTFLNAPGNNWQAGTSCNVSPNKMSGSFYQDGSWCGDMASWWWRFEEKQLFPAMLARQRIWQHRTLNKVAALYNGFQSWPFTTASRGTLANAVGAPSNLAQATCTAPYIWSITAQTSGSGTTTKISIPLDCSDLYNQWGNPVSYNFTFNSNTGIGTFYLLSETGILNPTSSSTRNIYVTSELSL